MILANGRLGLPRIAVIIPAYNRAGVISRAIDSVLVQDFGDFELIVVDDGSTDSTVAVARGYDDPRMHVVELGRNCGSNAARNAGITGASAPLIAFLDSDDTYLPHKLSTVIEEFERDPGTRRPGRQLRQAHFAASQARPHRASQPAGHLQ